MGYVPLNLYILTGDKRFKADFHKQWKRTAIGILITGSICFGALISGAIYLILTIGGL